jgi:hypothetical protein
MARRFVAVHRFLVKPGDYRNGTDHAWSALAPAICGRRRRSVRSEQAPAGDGYHRRAPGLDAPPIIASVGDCHR